MRALPLAPMDGFVLSRVDGRASIKDIAHVTGIPEPSVFESLEKLERLGAVEFDGGSPFASKTTARPAETVTARPVQPASVPAEARASVPGARPTRPVPNSSEASTHSVAPGDSIIPGNTLMPPTGQTMVPAPLWIAMLPPELDDAPELQEDVELDIEIRKRVLFLHRRIHDLDHYALLGLEAGADKKTIKRAYYELAKSFHPDKHFKKRLGAFKQKMEIIFARITEAHDTLADRTRRAEYDEYLGEVNKSRRIEAMMMGDVESELRAFVEGRSVPAPRAPEPAPRTAEPAPARAPSADPGRAPSGSPHAATSGAPAAAPPRPVIPPRAPPTPEEERAKRDALARRLRGGAHGSGAFKVPLAPKLPEVQIPQTSSFQYSNPQDAMDALKRRYEERVQGAKTNQVVHLLKQGGEARDRKDWVAAAQAFKQALMLSPEDKGIEQSYEESRAEADKVLAESYEHQAQYEERNQNWQVAARNWIALAALRADNAQAHERAANALVRAEGDLHRAGEFAKRAVALEPTNALCRMTLATVYFAAKLLLNARREVEAATQLDPQDPKLQQYLQALQKRAREGS